MFETDIFHQFPFLPPNLEESPVSNFEVSGGQPEPIFELCDFVSDLSNCIHPGPLT